MDCSLLGSSVQGNSPGKNTGVGCHFLLQGIFLTQESPAPGSPALQADSLLTELPRDCRINPDTPVLIQSGMELPMGRAIPLSMSSLPGRKVNMERQNSPGKVRGMPRSGGLCGS